MNNKEGSKTRKLNHYLQFSLQESFAFLLNSSGKAFNTTNLSSNGSYKKSNQSLQNKKISSTKKKRIEITEVSQDLLAQLHFFLTYCYTEPFFHDLQPLLAVYRNLNRYFLVRRGLAPMTRADA
jgi:hypothetical protein